MSFYQATWIVALQKKFEDIKNWSYKPKVNLDWIKTKNVFQWKKSERLEKQKRIKSFKNKTQTYF